MLVPVLIAGVVGYLLGSLPFGYLVAKAHGVDIFKAGSGNPGATNVKRVLGARAGYTVYLLDTLKGVLAAAWPKVLVAGLAPQVVRFLSDPYDGSLWSDLVINALRSLAAMQAAGLVGAVLGHSFCCFTRFKGGKGVATASGGLLVLMPVPILIGAAVWLITLVASRYVSLASMLAAITVPAAAWALGLSLALKVVVTLLGGLVILRHHANIRRLLAGTEHRWERKAAADHS